MPPLHKLTAVPAGWPLETVLDAFVHLTKYNPAVAAAQRAQEAVAARLVELWAANPAEAAAWRGLNEDRSRERLAELLFQHGRSEWSRCKVTSISEAGLERVALSRTYEPRWLEAHLRPHCSELAGRLAAAEAEAEETARKRQKVEAKGQEEQLREEKRQLAQRLEAAQAELHSAKEEVAQVNLQNAQLGASLEAAQAAAAEKQRELQAARQQRDQLTERLVAADASLTTKARELQVAQGEGAAQKERCEQLERRLAASEAEASATQTDLQRLQDECGQHKEHCEQLASRLAAAEAASGSKADWQVLLENAALKERGQLLGQQVAKAEAKLEQMLVEKGVCQERCRQLERQLAEVTKQAKCIGSGRRARATHVCRDPEEASSSHESNLSDQLGYTLVDDADASSVLSHSSWFSVKPHCFMPDAIFKTRNCGIDFFLMGRDLMQGSRVVAGDDATIVKVATKPELCRANEVVDLQAGAAMLRVTPDHLVQVPDATGEFVKDLYLPAGELKAGDRVMLDSGEPMTLTSVAIRSLECEVLKITFEPHLPVAVFSCPPCILSLGHKPKPPIRRGWEKKRGQGQGQGVDESMDGGASIPMTAGGEYTD
ncbi:unnamed protein product [Symbiodinium natans]|uniref:Hint domain-containing protein n=1 Tax=Symbiodinium natans TaxID=878477 RepID=A0A812JEH5_9DINO|nr:unnamed protein product [Symbiodinium natans]